MTEVPNSSSVRVDSILRDVLRARGLESADGRPLYAYKVTNGELSQLAHPLNQILGTRSQLELHEAAGLVLLAAGRFCARHEAGHWTWETALGEVLPANWRPDKRFYETVERGLAWWRRKIVVARGTSEFLVTVACEGGLPLALVRREGTHLRNYFGDLLLRREKFPMLDIDDSARSLSNLLPPTLVNDQLLAFAALLIDAVADLRQQVRGERDPFDALRRQVPDWEHRIPLRLDEGDARELLNDLLRAPAPELSSNRDDVFLRLHLDTRAGLRLGREAILPSIMSSEGLARLIGCSVDQLPARVLLSMEASDGVRRPFGRCTRVHGGESYRLERATEARCLFGTVSSGRIDLIASAAGGSSWRVLFPGGEELAELPWIFVDPGEESTTVRMLGIGSVRVRAPTVLVAVPPGVEPVGGESARIGEVPEVARLVWRIRGEVRFDQSGEVSVVRTGQERDDDARYVLSGRSTSLAPGLLSFWLGTPRLYEHVEDGRRRALNSSGVQWRAVGAASRLWAPLDERARGRGEIRYVENGETLFKTRATVLAPDFTCRVHPGTRDREGALVIDGLDIQSVAPQAEPGCVFEVVPDGENCRRIVCRLDVGAERPSSLHVALVLGDGSSAVVEAPFPAPQVAFVAARGRPLLNGASVSLERIASIRASVLTPRSDGYYLEARCSTGNFHLVDLPPISDGSSELPLEVVYPRVEQMLASDDDLDTDVELRIVRVGIESPGGARLRVRHFERHLIRSHGEEDGQATIRVGDATERDGGSARNELRLTATPIWAPAAEPVALQTTGEVDVWRFPHEGAAAGPWLVTAWEGAHLVARPTCFVARSEATDEVLAVQPSEPHHVALADAVRLHGKPLTAALTKVLGRIGSDPEDSDWLLLDQYLDTLDTLPANTYEVIKALVKDSDAVALAAMKSLPKMKSLSNLRLFPIVWEKLERLPFLWALVPFRSWASAARHLLLARKRVWEKLPDELRTTYDPTATVRSLVSRLRDHADPRSPFLECTADALSILLFSERRTDGLLGSALRDPSLRELRAKLFVDYRRLRERNSGRTWPSGKLGSLLKDAGISARHPGVPWISHDLLGVEVEDLPRFTNDVLNAPVVAASLSILLPSDSIVSRRSIIALQSLRSFDAEWFDEAYAMSTATLMAKKLDQEIED
jgi:hypothetical protein